MESVLLILLQVICTAVVIGAWVTLPLMVIPGATIIWVVSLFYIIITGFNPVSIAIIIFETLMMLITNGLDNVLMGGSAKAQGASWWSIGAAFVGAIVGSLLLPPLGGIPGALLLLFGAEYLQKKDAKASWTSVKAMVTGFGWAALTRFIGGGIMAFWFYVLLFLQIMDWVPWIGA
jgi:uncharacterized protein YqgC (DUF456 family)